MTVIGVLAHSKKKLGGSGLDDLRRALADKGVDAPALARGRQAAGRPRRRRRAGRRGRRDAVRLGRRRHRAAVHRRPRSAPPALAILPAGTANLFAGNLGVPTDLEAAVSIGLGGRRRTLDLGTVNGERFGVMAGVGFDAEMIRTAEAGLKDRLGRLGYIVAGALGLQRDAVQTRVTVDGTTWFEGPSTCVLVGNMGDVFGGISPFPDARPDDGRLDVGVVTADSVVDWARTLGTDGDRPAGSLAVRRDHVGGDDRGRAGRGAALRARRRRPVRDRSTCASAWSPPPSTSACLPARREHEHGDPGPRDLGPDG